MTGTPRLLRSLLGTAFGLAIAGILFFQIRNQNIFALLKNLSLSSILLAFFFYSFSTLLRALRWKEMIFSKNISLLTFFWVTSIHNFLNQLLPARTGELSYVVLLRKTQSVPSSEGVATLILARVFDLVAIGVLFLVSLLLFWGKVTVPAYKLFMVTFFSLPVLVLIFVGVFSRQGVERIRLSLSKWGLLKWKWVLKVSDFLIQLAQDLYQIKISGKLLKYALMTLVVWGMKFLAFSFLVRNFPHFGAITFWETVMGTTFSELASTLPIYGFAGLGTIEGGWTLGFLLLGFPQQEVILSAFCFHFLILSFSMVLGILGFVFLRMRGQK
ncbi:MAG: flippase-like domain-containing protein [Chlamydiae bacterium]|nr:flippase-like domain-containing protein [Chlamydiota bacterium]MBI3267288.1 flippase-like domain-containing protein [Chlamydiota bacterium]